MLVHPSFVTYQEEFVAFRFKKAWRNGKTAVVLDPMTFISRHAAQVPPRRFHLLTYHGVLAAAAARRQDVVPGHGGDEGGAQSCRSRRSPSAPGAGKPRSRPERMSWADLIRRVWLCEVLACPCGGRRTVLSMVLTQRRSNGC